MQVVKAIALQKQHVSFGGSTPSLPAKIKLWKYPLSEVSYLENSEVR